MTVTAEQRITLIAVLAITIGILVWDYVLLKDGVPGNTISSALKTASECLPIPILFGIWMAHSWWYMGGLPTHSTARFIGLVAVVVVSYLWWEASSDRVRLWLSAHPALTFQVGFVAGHWVWPQFSGHVGA